MLYSFNFKDFALIIPFPPLLPLMAPNVAADRFWSRVPILILIKTALRKTYFRPRAAGEKATFNFKFQQSTSLLNNHTV